MLNRWIQDLLARAGRASSNVRAVPLSSCLERHGNDLVLVFVDRGNAPSYVVKAARTAEFGFKIEAERSALERVAEHEVLRRRVPRALASGTTAAGAPYLLTDALSGTPAATYLLAASADGIRNFCVRSADFLLALRDAGGSAANADAASRNSLEHGAALAARISEDSGTRRAVAEILEAAEGGARRPLHGDFWPANLFLDGDGAVTGCIDWEFATDAGLLPVDAVWFAVNTAYFLGKRSRPSISIEEAFEDAFYRRGPAFEPVAGFWRRYTERTGGADAANGDPWASFVGGLAQLGCRETLAYGTPGGMDAVCRRLVERLVADRSGFGI